MHKLNLILYIFLFLMPISGWNQQLFPVKIALGNESTAIPYTRFFTIPVHPTFQVGTEYLYRNGLHHEWYQTANVGYIFHNYLYQGIYLNSEIGYDYLFKNGLKIKGNFGLGYLHTFTTQDEYQFKNGEYENGADWGNSRLLPSLAFGVGYKLDAKKSNSSELFLMYKSWIEYPYSPGFIPMMSHITLEVGCKFYLNSKTDEKE